MAQDIDYLKQIRTALFNPAAVIGDLWEFGYAWFTSRAWGETFFLSIPCFAFALPLLILGFMGSLQTKDQLLVRYAKAAEKEAPIERDQFAQASAEDSQTAEEKKAMNDRALLYFRRVLQLERDNKRARYYVAARYAARGSEAQARRMMEALAPAKDAGYPQAHGWLAMDLIRQETKGLKIDLTNLEHHLSMVAQWEHVAPFLIHNYAKLLSKKGDDESKRMAVDQFQLACRKDPAFYLPTAVELKRLGNTTLSADFMDSAIRHYEEKVRSSPEDERSRLLAAQGYVLKEDFEGAKKLLIQGLTTNDTPNLRRNVSFVLIEQFKRSLKEDGKSFQANWGFLHQALSLDPYNPRIGEELALLQQKKVALSEEFQEAIRNQIAEGKASPITYLILASAAVQNGNVEKGKSYLETAYQHAPNASIVANNYAMILVMISPPQIDKAREIIVKALERDPHDNAELYDSYGRILMLQKEYASAVAQFEKALTINNERLDSREAIIVAYEKQGLPEMAEAQRKALQSRKSSKKGPDLSK